MEKYQRTLTLDDVERIVELDEIACDIQKGARAVQDLDWFSVDGHFFKKPTFAREQLIRRISETFSGGIWDIAGALYALDLNRTPDELKGTPTRLKLITYVSRLDVPIKKAVKAIEDAFGLDEEEDTNESDPVDAWGLCSVLAREVGGSPDEWYDASPEKLRCAIKVIEDKVEAEVKAMGGSKGPPKDTPKIRAIAKFAEKLKELEATWQTTS